MEAIKRFDDIEHTPLRVFNRVVTMHNILEDFGKEALQAYIEVFNENERTQMYLMNAFLRKNGVKATKDLVTKDLKTEYNVGEEDEGARD